MAYKEQEVSLLVKIGHLEEAAELYRALLSMNPDNYRYDLCFQFAYLILIKYAYGGVGKLLTDVSM